MRLFVMAQLTTVDQSGSRLGDGDPQLDRRHCGMELKIEIHNGEYWWAGYVNKGYEMPYRKTSECFFNLDGGDCDDQFAPFMLSSAGRYIRSDEVFAAAIKNGIIELTGKGNFEVCDGYGNLKGAYLAAMNRHFKFNGKMPDGLFWRAPQYNTWIELGMNQTSEGILRYANDIIRNGFKPGVMMIDGGWQEDYGVFEFNGRKIPDPGFLIDELHKLGFKVMLWVSPIVASAGQRYKELRERGFLVKNKDNKPAVREWWSGYSAVIDFTNPAAVEWYRSELDSLIEKYGVDGFKFDAGDRYFYRDDDIVYKPTYARNQTGYFNEIGEKYSFNEFRAVWNFGGRAIVSRLHDKFHTWDGFGLNTLIPHTVVQGLFGYPYCCPDMVGGGIIACFGDEKQLDEELFVRWAQANAMMGMMQISVAPWRVLSEKNAGLVKEAADLHTKFGELFFKLAENASETGEPIVRHMAYEFPYESFETENGQFMLGSDILVAPVLEKGARIKKVRFPLGKWTDENGKIYDGGKVSDISVDMSSIPYFYRS